MQPALPGLQVPGLTLHGRGHQRATQDGDHFPLSGREHIMARQGKAGQRRAEPVQGSWQIMASDCGTRWQGRDGLSCLAHSAIGGHHHLGDKAITLAIPRLDETLRLPGVADGLAYSLQTVFNCGITDNLSRPYLVTQFLLWNHTVAMRQQISKRLEHFRSQSNRLASPAQEITLGVEEAIRKEVAHGLDLLAL